MPHYCVLAKALQFGEAVVCKQLPWLWPTLAPAAFRGRVWHNTRCQHSHPEPISILTSQLLHAKLGGWGFPLPGEGFASQVSAMPLPCRRRRTAGFMSPISPSRRKSNHLGLSCSLPLTRHHSRSAITLTHHHPLVLLLIYSSSGPAASPR